MELKLELADTPWRRQQGLMGRHHLDAVDGMLFVFPTEEDHVFWMHDTPLALDLLFYRADGSLAGVIERATPMTDTPRRVVRPSKYVVEVLAGVAHKKGLDKASSRLFIDSHWATP